MAPSEAQRGPMRKEGEMAATEIVEVSSAESAPSRYYRVCDLDSIWPGEMAVHEVEGVKIIVIHTESGVVRAVQHICPHQSFTLADGGLEGDILTCSKHLWEFNVVTGCGVNPTGAEIALYPVKVENGGIHVSIAGIEPKYARP